MVDKSRFPGRARGAYLESFRTRRMDHQFHYDTERQAQLWLAIHEAFSPARRDTECLRTYARAYRETAQRLRSNPVDLISIGCGGGQKDAELVKALKQIGHYVPADVSATLALTAHLRVNNGRSTPLVVDIAGVENLRRTLDSVLPGRGNRLIAFFGMLPNFEAKDALGTLSSAMRERDLAIISANLAPGVDYRAGVEKVLPQYDNLPTRKWISAALIDAGLEVNPTDVEFKIVRAQSAFRIEATYTFRRTQRIQLDGEKFCFRRGEVFRLFFSYRYQPENLARIFRRAGLGMEDEWITQSEEEGIFLCRRLRKD